MITTSPHITSSATDERLAELVERFLDRLRSGEAIDAGSFAAEHGEHAAALLEILPAVVALAGFPDKDPAPGFPMNAEVVLDAGVLGDFRITREIGRGGMGVVYEAEQVSLGRRVALKVLPHFAARDPRQLARFHVEAHAVAALNHPNIVPIFAVGSDHGVHYYAMQFIEGRSLADRIAVARREAESGGSRPRPGLAPAEVARLGVQAASALDHAHGLSILHRDIKPANLLVDETGRLWVVDFGLARVQTGSDLTPTGDVLGTLRYMSPEQALARGMLDPRSDVYSLGMTLFELLVLRPAFNGDDRQQILRQIAEEEPVRLRKIDPTIPHDLETIILKAMAKEPLGRYDSASELAEDLQRFLREQPIRARRPRPVERIGRWMRRHKTAVAATAAILLLAMIGLAAGYLMLWKEQGRTQENLEMALRSLDKLHVYLGEEGLNTNPEQTESILASLEADLVLYERLAGQNPQNREALWGAARAHRRMGDIRARTPSQLDKAEAAYRVADRLLSGLSSQAPSDFRFREERALTLGNWGKLIYHLGGQRGFRGSLAAEAPLRQALAIDRDLIANRPMEARYQRRFVQNAFYLIGVLFIADRHIECELWLTQARDVLRGLADGSLTDRLDLAVDYKLLGDMMHATGRPEEGARAYDQSIVLMESLSHESFASPADRRSVVELFGRLGQHSFCSTSQPGKALEFYARALPTWDRLVARIDLMPAEQYTRVHAHSYLGYLFENNDRPRDALAPRLRAVELGEALLRAHPSVAEYRKGLAGNARDLGFVLAKLGRAGEAWPYFDRSLELVPETPDSSKTSPGVW